MTHTNDFLHEAFWDPVFKHILSFEDIRNDCLSSLLDVKILESTLLDSALTPFDAHHEQRALAELLSHKKTQEQLHSWKELLPLSEHELLNHFIESGSRMHESLPDKPRLTALDLICRTSDRIINVEIQLISQPYWDLRMLYHAGGLIWRQLFKGFSWNAISGEGYHLTQQKTLEPAFREVIVIGLMIQPPVERPQSALKGMPWYSSTRWGQHEWKRVFEFTNRENREMILPGALIYQYNISALAEDFQKNLDESPEAKTIRWLRYFAKEGRAKRLNELKYLQTQQPMLWAAYQKLTLLPEYVLEQQKEDAMKYQLTEEEKGLYAQIAFEQGIEKGIEQGREQGREEGIEQGREQGREEGIEKKSSEIVRQLLKRGFDLEMISAITELSRERIEAIQKSEG